MLRFESMKWAHAFSYGAQNSIEFDKNPLTQLIGKNGNGKSSIALILEEVLYNKNSKGVKKSSILNRNTSSKNYSITLTFSKDRDQYVIETNRGSAQTVKLTCNGKDISSHTSTGTYKLIENIIGYDHKTFTQIVYQSNAFSLEFLTATDSNRKKFLIDLLNLDKYTAIAEKVKEVFKEVSKDAEIAKLKLSTIDSWLNNLKQENLTKQELLEVPTAPTNELKELAELKVTLANIDKTNSKIVQNNTYKELLSNINIDPPTVAEQETYSIVLEQKEIQNSISVLNTTIKNVGPILDKCGSCGQPIDSSHKKHMVAEAKAKLPNLLAKSYEYADSLKVIESNNKLWSTHRSNLANWEKYFSQIDNTLPLEILDKSSIKANIESLEADISKTNTEIASLVAKNSKITAHNTKVDTIYSQINGMQKDRVIYENAYKELSDRLETLQILTKTFSPSGFIAYKIESLVKDLEDLTNEYLNELSSGRFQLSFKISSSDKLDVIINDNGTDIDIYALSNGELARVNVSTLLAIRKLMQSISNTRTNLLILDETIEALDLDGKEKLIDVLLKEEYLNVILISHSFTHPLIEKVYIMKENNISRIENG